MMMVEIWPNSQDTSIAIHYITSNKMQCVYLISVVIIVVIIILPQTLKRAKFYCYKFNA